MSFWTNIVRLYLICLYQHSHFQTIIRICFSFSYFLMQNSILRIGFGWLDIRSIGGVDLHLRRCVWGLYHCSQQVGGFKWWSLPQFSHGELWSQKNQLLDSKQRCGMAILHRRTRWPFPTPFSRTWCAPKPGSPWRRRTTNPPSPSNPLPHAHRKKIYP